MILPRLGRPPRTVAARAWVAAILRLAWEGVNGRWRRPTSDTAATGQTPIRADLFGLAVADKPQSRQPLSKGQGPKSGPCMETVWWRRRGIEPLVQRKTHSDIYKLSRRLHLARRTSTDGVTDGPAD